MRTLTILNPAAGGGRAGKVWEKLKTRIEPPAAAAPLKITSAPGDAIRFTRQALEHGIESIYVVGGDGTFNEAVNGYLYNDRPINSSAVLLPVAAGTGSDFSRLLESRSVGGKPLVWDVGKIAYTRADGETAVRYFANVASCGQSAMIAGAKRRAALTAGFGGKAAYFLSILGSLRSYRATVIGIFADGSPLRPDRVRCVAVANGRTFGGGLVIAPESDPGDGELDLTILGDAPVSWLLRHAWSIYRGNHRHLKHISRHRVRELVLTTDSSDVGLETDGEVIGRLPATFGVLPKALRVAVPAGV